MVSFRLAGTLTVAALLAVACTGGSPDSPTVSDPGTSSSRPAGPTSAAPTSPAGSSSTDWLQYHGNPQRTGYAAGMPAASGQLTAHIIRLDGQVYASPIVIGDTVVVATEQDSVYGLNRTGRQRWKVSLGTPTPRNKLPCGNIDPLGITGTPIYDPTTGSVFLVASIGDRVSHQLFALDPTTGNIRWHRSVDLPGADPQAMQQRAALAIAGGRVWVPFGGLTGDCADYKGRLVGVPLTNGEPISYTVPTTREAGIWAPPGPVLFGGDLLVAVGNGESVGDRYDFSDSVLRIRDGRLVDSFSPSSWAADNASDLDLGSQGPAVVDNRWIFQAGKSGTGYLLRADRLGGIGGQVWQGPVCVSFGGTAVVGDLVYLPCTDGVRAVQISPAGTVIVRWHAPDEVAGSPVVGGGRVYAVDQAAGALVALDPASGRQRERVSVGEVSRFATPAISGSQLYLPTLVGLAIINSD
ncbi:MAG TPA: PQQ-binding-like beta-propeller repeat protein [Jatrophihabitans sp.]|nr:PQQ-binding-like beta-propeller repeat protein [Jatrophihabitans sp.]